jgi:tetratricopeptide (TPR) repeat protein
LANSDQVIRRGRESKELDIYRLRAALVELTQFSLVTHTEKTDSYSMHALVHKWARERPGMSVTEQAVWVHAATELLSHCILLPPLGNTTEDERIRKYLLPHIDHVSECQSSIDQRMRDKRIARMKPWPIFEGTFNRDKALTYAKFSTVYAQHGLWDKAKRLQSAVKDFTTQVLGVENPVTRRIMLALSGTLFNLGQSDDAAALQEQVLEACMLHKGPDHYETYAAKRTLGECRRLQGRITDATKLLEEAVAGLSRHHGDHHEETLNAIDSLAQTVSMFYTEESTKRSRELHGMAVDGLKKILGQDHLRALMAMENWCINEVQSSDKTHLKDAHDMMVVVFEARKEKLGREHAYTLLAMVNIARVKVGLGDLKEAEELMLFGLPIAARNLGVGHQGYLWGRYILGQILVRQKRWEEAEQLLSDVTQRQCGLLQGRGKYHPDRLGALVELAVVYDALGKVKECDEVADEALEGFARISTSEHPVARKLREDRIKWNERRLQENGDQSVSV